MKIFDDKLKASDYKLRELDNSFQAFQADAKQSVEDLIAEYEEQKNEMARRFDAYTADGTRPASLHTPVFCNAEQVLAEARAEAEGARDSPLISIRSHSPQFATNQNTKLS